MDTGFRKAARAEESNMYQKARLHNGLMADCIICTPDRKKKRERRDFERPQKREKSTTVEGILRRQMAEEIGEEEVSKDLRISLMMHYGIIAPRIDRRVTKPNWMEESTWKRLKQEFHNITRGLVPERMKYTTRPAGAGRPQSQPQLHSQTRPHLESRRPSSIVKDPRHSWQKNKN